jgi:hypothetical protein
VHRKYLSTKKVLEKGESEMAHSQSVVDIGITVGQPSAELLNRKNVWGIVGLVLAILFFLLAITFLAGSRHGSLGIIKVRGNSMQSVLPAGTTLFVWPKRPKNGDYVSAWVETKEYQGLVIKKYQQENDNSPQLVSTDCGDTYDDFCIRGVIVHSWVSDRGDLARRKGKRIGNYAVFLDSKDRENAAEGVLFLNETMKRLSTSRLTIRDENFETNLKLAMSKSELDRTTFRVVNPPSGPDANAIPGPVMKTEVFAVYVKYYGNIDLQIRAGNIKKSLPRTGLTQDSLPREFVFMVDEFVDKIEVTCPNTGLKGLASITVAVYGPSRQ